MEQEINVVNVDEYIAKLDSTTIEDSARLDELIDEIVDQLEKKGYLRTGAKQRPVKILLKRRLDKDLTDKMTSWCKGAFSFGWKEGYKEGFDSDYKKKLDDEEFFRQSLEELHRRMEGLRYKKPRSDAEFNAYSTAIVRHMAENKHLKENAEAKVLAGAHSIISRRYAKFLKNLNFGKVQRAYQLGWKAGYKEARADR